MTRTHVPTIERLGVDPVQVAHPARQVCLRRLDEQMVVIRHQTVRVADPAEALDGVAQHLKEELAVRINEEDVLPRVAATREPTGVADSAVFRLQLPSYSAPLSSRRQPSYSKRRGRAMASVYCSATEDLTPSPVLARGVIERVR